MMSLHFLDKEGYLKISSYKYNNKPIKQTVYKVGYKNPEHFFRRFRKYHATISQPWRKMHRCPLTNPKI
ncbi:AraC family two component transcriptional regulator [Calothrix sp. NIES-4071]|nr:AraC family two component transcriptional regulator [Calothrix sp. NIES-4071]BAZ54933.1 AraC family two component transcriptional regulator [Calothrix sp. NIES-4105]